LLKTSWINRYTIKTKINNIMEENYYPLEETYGFLLKKLPQDIHAEVKSVVDNIQNNFNGAIPFNEYLAGQIDKEYAAILPNKATQYIRYITGEYIEENPQYIEQQFPTEKPTLQYNGECWVNFQEKYEYNPIHNHGGVFSFVIWHQIPFYFEDEQKYGAGKKPLGHNTNGQFQFIHYNGTKIINTPLSTDKHMEGYIAIFPSSLNHIVYPFYTSDEYRITMSGNVTIHE
jgi:hypothetical protein